MNPRRSRFLFAPWCVVFAVLLNVHLVPAVGRAESGVLAQHAAQLEAARALGAAGTETDTNLVRVYFYEALDNVTYLEKAERKADEVLRASPRNTIVKMYQAALLAMRAREAFWPNQKLRLIREALRRMDAVIAEAPKDYELRMLQASTWLNLPSFFGHGEAAAKELAALARRFDAETAAYPEYIKVNWLNFFLSNEIACDRSQLQERYLAMGGKLADLE